jgi:hypothetical protein
VPFINLKERRRFASPCLFKQKFVCDSVWQTALDFCRNRFLLVLPVNG